MPASNMLEMVADWRAMGRQRGKRGALEWYKQKKDGITIHPLTRERVEMILEQITALQHAL